MIVHWDGHELAEWDQVHASAAGSLQQDWAYGSCLKMLGVPVFRARVLDQGVQVAQAQFIVRKWGRFAAVALCTNPGQYRWLLDNETQQRVDKNLDGLPLPFFDHYVQSRKQPSKNILTIRADLGRERVAAMLFLIHGEAAIYQIGWTTDQGRELNAHHLTLWRAIEELQTRGVRVLDLGGVNTVRSAGVARFKMRTGGKVLTLAGTYI